MLLYMTDKGKLVIDAQVSDAKRCLKFTSSSSLFDIDKEGGVWNVYVLWSRLVGGLVSINVNGKTLGTSQNMQKWEWPAEPLLVGHSKDDYWQPGGKVMTITEVRQLIAPEVYLEKNVKGYVKKAGSKAVPAASATATTAPASTPASGPSKALLSATGIPKILHQTWSGDSIPSGFSEYVESWLSKHPDWQYMFWTDEANRRLVQENYPDFLGTFDGLVNGMPSFVRRKHIRQADTIRYMIMETYGGVYADLDFEALKPLDELISKHEAILGQEPLAHANLLNNAPRTVCNAIIMSKPGHPFWASVLSEIKSHTGGDPVDSTGPRMLERVFSSYDDSTAPVFIAPPDLFYPKFDPGALENLKRTCEGNPGQWKETCEMLSKRNWDNGPQPDSLAIHHWVS